MMKYTNKKYCPECKSIDLITQLTPFNTLWRFCRDCQHTWKEKIEN